MSLHFLLPKIRTFRFSLHTSRLSLHGEVTIVALNFAMSSHFPLPNISSSALFPLFQMARAARRVIENPRQMIKSCPVPFCSSHRKTESKWGGSWEKVHNVQIFSFCFFTDSYGGFNEETSVENRLKKYCGIAKLRHFL